MIETDLTKVELNIEDYFILAPSMESLNIGLNPILPPSIPEGTFVVTTYRPEPSNNSDPANFKRVISVCRIAKKGALIYVLFDKIPQAVFYLAEEELVNQPQITGTGLFAKPTIVSPFDYNENNMQGTSHFTTIKQPRKANHYLLPFEVSILTPKSFALAKAEQVQRLKLLGTK